MYVYKEKGFSCLRKVISYRIYALLLKLVSTLVSLLLVATRV